MENVEKIDAVLKHTIADCEIEVKDFTDEQVSVIKLIAARLSVTRTIFDTKTRYTNAINQLRLLIRDSCMN